MNLFDTSSTALWPGTIKILEETSELNLELAKLMMSLKSNGEFSNWTNPEELIKNIEDEAADVYAAISWFIDHNVLNGNLDWDRISDRVRAKKAKFDLWKEL